MPVTGVDEAVMSANPGRKFGDCLMEVDSGAGWVHAVAWSPSGQLLPREQVSLAALRCSKAMSAWNSGSVPGSSQSLHHSRGAVLDTLLAWVS